MRIIAGQAKGKKLFTPKSDKVTRPALAKVREAIFSSLGDIDDKIVFDVFAGTGSLGFEALSRGAKKAYFIDGHDDAISCLIKNIKHLGYDDSAKVFKRKLPYGLKGLKLEGLPDIIFCDPPYDKGLLNKTLEALKDHKFIDHNSLIIVEHTSRELPNVKGLSIIKQKKYGQTLITFLRLENEISE